MNKITPSAKEPAMVRLKACDRCAAIKQVCNRKDGENECTRCIRLGICCQITRAHKPMGRPRKWPRKEKVKLESDSPPALVYSPTSPDSSESSFSSCESDVERGVKSERSLPPTSAGLMIGLGGLKDKRTRSGCLSCKIRRKKCDESYPKCGDCSRLKLSCERRTRNTMSPECTSVVPFEAPLPPTPGWHDMIPEGVNISIFCPTIFPIATSSEEKNLLQHYAVSVSRSLSVVPDEINPFLSLFMQMAMSQTAMRFALLGLSASHLRRIHPSFETVMTKYLAMAMEKTRGLLDDAQTSDEAAIEGLATILVLCLHEICEGKSRKWQLHLKAAVSLINSRRNCKFPQAVRFLLEATTYFDTIATLSFSKPPLLQDAIYPPDFEPKPTSPLISNDNNNNALQHRRPVTPHALFGTAADLFPIINDIACLAQKRAETPLTVYSHHAFLAHATQIETRLLTWRPATSINTPSDPYLAQKMSAASHALQWAAIMRLHQLVEGHDKSHPKVQTSVRNILASVSMIPEGDLSESILVFPMLMAGLGAVRDEDKQAVRSRMSVMGCAIGFGNVYEAQELIERVWRMEEEEEGWRGSGVPWDVMMMANGQTLIMS